MDTLPDIDLTYTMIQLSVKAENELLHSQISPILYLTKFK